MDRSKSVIKGKTKLEEHSLGKGMKKGNNKYEIILKLKIQEKIKNKCVCGIVTDFVSCHRDYTEISVSSWV